MKRIISMFICLLLVPVAALAQTIAMEEQHLTFAYPDSWLVLSPQLAMVYAPLLEENGLDPAALSQEM